MALAAGGGGIRPRGSSADYPAHEAAGGVIGAAVIPSDQVRKVFATDLNSGGYLVIRSRSLSGCGQGNRPFRRRLHAGRGVGFGDRAGGQRQRHRHVKKIWWLVAK
jgi:hypothetical protein